MDRTDELLAILKDPRSVASEGYRGLRTSLQRALSNDVKTIMFVSSYGGDGKSMVCANVAVAMTQLFLDVILVDADLRRPTLTNLFDAVDAPGLGDLLGGDKTLDEVIVNTAIDRLKLIPAGVVAENPGNLLGRPALGAFCKDVARKGDVVIIDTSPVAACNDALSIGRHIDTAVMVVSPRRWDGDVEVRIKATLDQHHIPLMGVVLNGSTPGEGYGGPYGYGGKSRTDYGYGYYGYDVPKASATRTRKGFMARLKGLFGPEP